MKKEALFSPTTAIVEGVEIREDHNSFGDFVGDIQSGIFQFLSEMGSVSRTNL
jgi:hypothetical protein